MKSTMQAKSNKSPDRLDYREPAVNFPRKYFWARKTCWFIVPETFPGDEQIPSTFQRRKSPWKPDCLPRSTEMDVPHVGRTSGSCSHGLWDRWGLSSSQAPVDQPGAPQPGKCLRPQFLLPWKPSSVTCSVLQDLFCFWKTPFQKCLCKKFLVVSWPAEISKLYPCTICYEVNAILEIPVERKHPRLRLSLIPWEFYLWCGEENKTLRIKSWC